MLFSKSNKSDIHIVNICIWKPKKRGTEAQSNEKSHTHLSYKHKHRQEIFEIICRTKNNTDDGFESYLKTLNAVSVLAYHWSFVVYEVIFRSEATL